MLHEHISSLPYVYDTVIGENGASLSGGQKQRLALARAFYKDSQILILDEPTSALDQNTEEEIINEILQSDSSLTIVMIAHRKNTLINCDRTFHLEGGAIVNIGSPTQILT